MFCRSPFKRCYRLHWSGKQTGEGGMTILESRANELVRIRLDFLKPLKATNTGEFTFQPDGSRTYITWNMFGKNNFTAKAMGLFLDCDRMVGSQFDVGLANMKEIVEVQPAASAV
jgi:hypothetical protein